MIRRLFSSSQEAQFLHRIEVPVSFSALIFRVTGTNGATPATARDVGRLRFTVRNKPFVDADFDFLQQIEDHWFGSREFSSTASGAFNASVLIPRSFIGDRNVEYINKADEAVFETTFTQNLFDRIASGFLAELYAVVDEGPQSYNLTFFQQSYPTLSASQIYTDDISTVENVCAAYVSDIVSSVLTLIGGNLQTGNVFARKGDLEVNASVFALQAYTGAKYALEGVSNPAATSGTGEPIVELFGHDKSDLSARLVDSYKLQFTNGSGGTSTPQILTVGMYPNPDRLGESAAETKDRYANVKKAKAAAGKTRQLTVLETMGV